MKRFLKLFFSFIALVAIISLFSGCESEEKRKESIEEDISYQLAETIDYESENFLSEFESVSYFVVDEVEKKEEDCYSVICSVSSPDISEGIKKYRNYSEPEIPTEQEMDAEIKKLIENSEIKTTQIELVAFKTEDGYAVELTEEFIDALYGYSYIYCRNVIEDSFNSLLESGDGNE